MVLVKVKWIPMSQQDKLVHVIELSKLNSPGKCRIFLWTWDISRTSAISRKITLKIIYFLSQYLLRNEQALFMSRMQRFPSWIKTLLKSLTFEGFKPPSLSDRKLFCTMLKVITGSGKPNDHTRAVLSSDDVINQLLSWLQWTLVTLALWPGWKDLAQTIINKKAFQLDV